MNNVSNRVGGNTRTRPRVRLVHEPDNLETSLLSSNRAFTGQRHISGGSRAVSRLVEPEIQLAPDTNHQNILSNIKDIANKTVASTGEAVSKLKGQITDAGQNIKITAFSYAYSSGTSTLALTGIASDRYSLQEFQKNLSSQKIFKIADLPISDYAKD